MGRKTDYVAEKYRVADDLASRTSGVTRSAAERDAENKAWNEARAAQKQSEATGAGRGGQGGPTAAQARQNKGMMSDAEKSAREEMDFKKWSEPNEDQKYKKGGMVSSASKRADGCAVKGKTKGRMV